MQAKTPFTRAQAAPKKEQKLIPTIMGMATGNPPYRASQEQALQVAESCPECTSIKPVLARIYGNSRIDYRYMAVPDFTPEQRLEGDDNFFDDDLNFRMPVEKRLDKFREVAVPLVTDVCARALKDAGVQARRSASSWLFLPPASWARAWTARSSRRSDSREVSTVHSSASWAARRP